MSILSMVRGDTADFRVTLTDASGAELPLGSLGLTFTARHGPLTITKTVGFGVTVTDASGGIATVRIEPADTTSIEDRTIFTWDLEVRDGAVVQTPLSGELLVEMDVTW